MTEHRDKLHGWIDDHQDEIIEALRGVLRIPSKKDEPAPGAPFGLPCRAALDYTLDLCRKMGFRTRDVEGYAGHAEFGEGDEMVAAMGHLDVVPEGDRWQHDPYGAEIDGGYIYARGSSDDKGPTYAALFAARALMATGLPLKRRVRVIFGCDEESGFGCVHYYWKTAGEEQPVYAFTPDACFPLVYAEKGIADLTLEHTIAGLRSGLHVSSAHGGLRTNIVPDYAEALVKGDAAALYGAAALAQRFWDRNVSALPEEAGLRIRAIGKSAHGSQPRSGDNAVLRLAHALLELDLPADKPWLNWIVRTADPDGTGLGISGQDDVAGALTSNPGVFSLENGRVRVTYNIRYPVTWTGQDVLDRCQPVIQEAGWKTAEFQNNPSLYVPLDREPVKTLMRVYQEETGDRDSKPATMGGGTYARATPRAVAFGPGFPGGSDGPAHQPDERIAIESVLRAARIYAVALYELANAPGPESPR